jgi:GTP-binding protein HflX
MEKLQRCVLVNLIRPDTTREQAEKYLEELKSLVTTYGGAVVVKIIQKKDHPDNDTYIGKGKAEELKETVRNEKAEIVVINDVVKPGQKFNLQRFITETREDVKVWDRVDLILEIFSKHANTAEAKLQIELARMNHMGPRMYGLGGTVLSRQGGGIGTRGIGETNIELMKRHWRTAIKQVRDKLDKQVKEREKQLQRRKELGLETVSIVGYTNAGKSSLFNVLTKKDKLVENALFATLDSAVGKLYLPGLQKTVLISDTIGFIQNLPPQLVDAFKSTLLESINADILLHVIDVADPDMDEKIETVEKILTDLGAGDKKKIYVFNKIDMPSPHDQNELIEKFRDFAPVFISTVKKEHIGDLIHEVEKASEFHTL